MARKAGSRKPAPRAEAAETPQEHDPTKGDWPAHDAYPPFVLEARSVLRAQIGGADAMAAASQVAIEGAFAVARFQWGLLH